MANAAFRLAGALALAAFAAASAAAQAPESASGGADWFGNERVQFFRLAPFSIPVVRDGRLLRQVSLTVTLETGNVSQRNKVIERRLALQNAFLKDLYAVLALHDGEDGRALNLDTVKVRLRRVADGVLGPGIARDILIESVHVRRFPQEG